MWQVPLPTESAHQLRPFHCIYIISHWFAILSGATLRVSLPILQSYYLDVKILSLNASPKSKKIPTYLISLFISSLMKNPESLPGPPSTFSQLFQYFLVIVLESVHILIIY